MEQQVLLKAPKIPNKVYFKIGEVSNLVGVEAYVLRYWETEFSIIKPHRAKSNQRLYRKRDVENILFIKKLLYNEGYTISGARKILASGGKKRQRKKKQAQKITAADGGDGRLAIIKNELMTIQQMLTKPPPARTHARQADKAPV